MESKDYIRNISVMAGGLSEPARNTPNEYSSRQRQYMSPETGAFVSKYAKYASDFFSAEVQGVDPEDFYAWQTEMVRMADVIRPSASATRRFDDYKMVLFANGAIDHIPPGAKLVSMGSTWLSVNPQNISNAMKNGIFQRCNTVWNHLDYYGNILSEPLCVSRQIASASANDAQDTVLITQGNFDFKCQFNPKTAELRQNSRVILGNSAYALRGVTDFIQEFTGDYESVHLLEFTGYWQEPIAEIDDMVNHVAGGLAFSWVIAVTGTASLPVGQTAQFAAASTRNGVAVSSTAENPISYEWTSSDPAVASVDAQGLVSAHQAGECVITASLVQNAAKTASWPLAVSEADAEPHIAFVSTPPAELGYFESGIFTAAYYEFGAETGEAVEWTLSGADEDAYSYTVDGNTLTVTCWGASDTPLTVTASFDGQSVSAQTVLNGV